MTRQSTIFMCLTAFAAAGTSGCTKPNNTTCADNYCQDETLPFCDVDGSFSGDENTCIAVECTPGEFEACRGETELRCNAAGNNYDIGQCELGCDPAIGCIIEVIDNDCTPGEVRCGEGTIETCNADGEFESEVCTAGCVPGAEPHCAYASPRFLPDICDTPAANQSTFSVASFSTDDDASCNGGIVTQTAVPEICVVRYGQIIIPNSGSDVVISGSRAVAFVADEQLLVEGTLDVSANAGIDGPGGGFSTSGGATSTNPNPTGRGGGGAGFVAAGGSGGSLTADGGAANGGAAITPLDTILAGGPRPASSPAISTPNRPGGGGGALTLVACRGRIDVTGTLDAGGGGGASGKTTPTAGNSHGGAGGGAGGYIVIQGLAVSITGRVFANGGAGGNGLASDVFVGGPGSDGLRANTPASPNVRHSNEGLGGFGRAVGATSSQPANGTKPGTEGLSAGGGGGAMGRIIAVTPAQLLPAISTTQQSPQVLSSDTLVLR